MLVEKLEEPAGGLGMGGFKSNLKVKEKVIRRLPGVAV